MNCRVQRGMRLDEIPAGGSIIPRWRFSEMHREGRKTLSSERENNWVRCASHQCSVATATQAEIKNR